MLGNVPVPERLMDCGLPEALSVMDTEAAREPAAVGLKVMLIEQFAAAAKVLGESGQVVVSVKSPGFAPARPKVEMVSGPVPVLVRVTDCVPLLVPTF